MNRLNFNVRVSTDIVNPEAIQREWDRIAKKLERAAKGRSKSREVSVAPGR